jgi:predicted XRE-type DNA-binding protein
MRKKEISGRSVKVARAFIKEIGTQKEVAEVVGVKQPTVSRWSCFGMSTMRENDLRVRFPHMSVWDRYPSQSEAR